jgi:hypothetical protein
VEVLVKLFLSLLLWLLLFAVAWPLAIAVLVLFPLVWLIALPFRVAGVVLSATFALVKAILFLPARLLGAR